MPFRILSLLHKVRTPVFLFSIFHLGIYCNRNISAYNNTLYKNFIAYLQAKFSAIVLLSYVFAEGLKEAKWKKSNLFCRANIVVFPSLNV
jgi:hypothetical protein